jgi:hypothetical protein
LNPPAQPVSPLVDHTDAPACQRCGACCFSPSETYVRIDGADWTRLGPDAERIAHFIGNRAYLRMTGGRCAALAVSLAAPLEALRWGAQDVARFLDVPADMIDAGISGSSITYANITERNLQFLITALQPAITRREEALSRLVAAPAYVKLNSDALMRMDPSARWKLHADKVRAGLASVNEIRDIEDLPGIGEDGDRFLWPPFRMQLDSVEYEGGSNVAGPPIEWEAPS